MVDSELMDFFNPLLDDELSKTMLRLVGAQSNDGDFEPTLEKLLDFLEAGEKDD
jgi:hypothetical protein